MRFYIWVPFTERYLQVEWVPNDFGKGVIRNVLVVGLAVVTDPEFTIFPFAKARGYRADIIKFIHIKGRIK
ncbi:MAG TPA: hypothetical protein ENI23_10925 [bacterium]|nr:hypothetical protein [bacterium]